MRGLIIVAVLIAIALVIIAGIKLLNLSRKLADDREARLNHLKKALRAVYVALDHYDTADALGQALIDEIRAEIMTFYNASAKPRHKLKAGERARQRIQLALYRTRPFLIAPEDEAGRTFLREATEALWDNDKEISV